MGTSSTRAKWRALRSARISTLKTYLTGSDGLPINHSFVDECHLCCTARKLLLPRFPQYLAPKEGGHVWAQSVQLVEHAFGLQV